MRNRKTIEADKLEQINRTGHVRNKALSKIEMNSKAVDLDRLEINN